MRRLLLLWLLPATALAHVGSPDVFLDANAGPYKVLVTIRPPQAIPGRAEVWVQAPDTLSTLDVASLPLDGPGSKVSPEAEPAALALTQPRTFHAEPWLTSTGAWQVRLTATGPEGSGSLSVPVPTLPTRTKTMNAPLGLPLLAALVFLVAAILFLAAAGAREGHLGQGERASRLDVVRGRWAAAGAAAVLVVLLAAGARWWISVAQAYQKTLYFPITLTANEQHGNLVLQLSDHGLAVDDLVPDHGHLMHLYAVRVPRMDEVFHLHPQRTGPGRYELALPTMPEGRYQLFADVVHRSGVPETGTTAITLDLPDGAPLVGDNAGASAPGVSRFDEERTTAVLADGTKVIWDREGPVHARVPTWFRFRVLGPDGRPAELEPYMGMAGHAAFIKWDLSVFAHIHPTGSVPMPMLMMAHAMAHPQHLKLAFPYGIPSAGDYRLFVQFKRDGTIETAAFDFAAQ